MKYPELDPSSLEPDFSQHMSALTTEALHSKAAIAEQLSWRDRQLTAALAKVAELEQELADVHALDAWADGAVARHWRTGPSASREAYQCQAIDASSKAMVLEFADSPAAARRAAVEYLSQLARPEPKEET